MLSKKIMIKNIHQLKNKILLRLGVRLARMNHLIEKATLPKFGNNPDNISISFPRRIINPDRIFIGNNVALGPGSFLFAQTHYPTEMMRHPNRDQSVQVFDPKIVIGDNVTATGILQIAAVSTITIEEDVMFATNVLINDSSHGYDTANIPYRYQKLLKIAPILIKKGCWIGQNAVILSGVTIGENTIIGSNSVVSRNIPSRCIAVGSPARILKRWDEATQRWRHTDKP